MNFVHLHNHSHYSLLDGLATPEGLVKKAVEQGSNAVALTDHGVMYGAIDLYKAAKKADIKPIIGCEAYVAIRSRHDKESGIDNRRFHLLLLAENMKGYKNLLQLTTKAHLEGMYYKPRIDLELLREHSKGLIATSTCLNGQIPRALEEGNPDKARDLLNQYLDIFGKENFYMELQDHPHIPEQGECNKKIIELAKEYDLPLIATNDCHYINSGDDEAHDIMLCIQTGAKLDQDNRMTMMGEDFSLRPKEELAAAFAEYPEALSNTQEIADRCKIDFDFGTNLIPAYDIPDNKTDTQYLRELCIDGLVERYSIRVPKSELMISKTDNLTEKEKEILERLDYELKIIGDMGFNKYFLIVWDFVAYARREGIMVGPGRGSAAGSLVSYVLAITNLDPIEHQLLFERFLNPARVSMPDVDIDFADNRRDEVIQYVVDKYGQDHVAQISTFGTMAARAAVKDVGRAMGVSFDEMNALAKMIPDKPGTKLQEALDIEPELKKAYDTNERYKKLIDVALKIEGMVRHISVHACAVIIAPEPMVNFTALQHPPKDDTTVITQLSAKPLEALGLLKMDFLGLKNLTIIRRTLDLIKERHDVDIDIDAVPITDPQAYEVFAKGETTGVFQFESPGMRRYLRQQKPTEFEDIVAMVSLYRPGPMDWIPDYMARKHGKKEVKYIHPSLEPFLKNTYGIGIYQEQILEIARFFAGFSLGEADLLRRAIGKKIASELMAQKEKFIEGSIKQGHSKKIAIEIFEKVIEPFAGYGFNKSHAAGYSLIAYQTAYLKANYLPEFMAALLTCDSGNSEKVTLEIEECRNNNIEVLPPDVNESGIDFNVIGEKDIRFGLSAIKGLGDGPIKEIIAQREAEGKFTSLEDFAMRVEPKTLNKKTMEALAKSGALDSLAERNLIIENIEIISHFAKENQKQKNSAQTDLFGMMGQESLPELQLQTVKPATQRKRLEWEKELMGLYITSHPLAGLETYMKGKCSPITSLTRSDAGKTKKVGGLITERRKITTKKGETMCILQIADLTGKISVPVFPRVYKNYIRECETEEFITVSGKADLRNDEFQVIANELKISSLQAMRENAIQAGVYDPNDTGLRSLARSTVEEEQEEKTENNTENVKPANPKNDNIAKDPSHQNFPHPHQILEKFTVVIPIGSHKDKLLHLKNILVKYPGNTEVELFIEREKNTVPIPIKVNITDTLKNEVQALFS